jgi:Group II intron, maturase-specific domain
MSQRQDALDQLEPRRAPLLRVEVRTKRRLGVARAEAEDANRFRDQAGCVEARVGEESGHTRQRLEPPREGILECRRRLIAPCCLDQFAGRRQGRLQLAQEGRSGTIRRVHRNEAIRMRDLLRRQDRQIAEHRFHHVPPKRQGYYTPPAYVARRGTVERIIAISGDSLSESLLSPRARPALRGAARDYADDFVVLCRYRAAEVLAQSRRWFAQMGLTLNEQKTRGRRESFTFLGYTFGPMRYRKDGHWYLGAVPAKKAVKRIKGRIRQILRPTNQEPWEEVVADLNRVLRGWARYSAYGTRLMAYRAVDHYVWERARHFLRRRHKVPSRGTRRFSADVVFGELGVFQLRRFHLASPAHARV